jgi:hypothetical protein
VVPRTVVVPLVTPCLHGSLYFGWCPPTWGPFQGPLLVVGALPPGAGGRVPLYGFCGLVVNTLKRGGTSYCGGPPGNTLLAWFLVLWLVPSYLGSISGSPVSGWRPPTGGRWQGPPVRFLWVGG